MKLFIAALLGALSISLPSLSLAHTELAHSAPASGAELAESPSSIEIQFKAAARLTSVVIVGANEQERRLEFKPSEKPNAFTVLNPNLELGRNEILWKALSKDGHVASGKLIYTLKSAAKSK